MSNFKLKINDVLIDYPVAYEYLSHADIVNIIKKYKLLGYKRKNPGKNYRLDRDEKPYKWVKFKEVNGKLVYSETIFIIEFVNVLFYL